MDLERAQGQEGGQGAEGGEAGASDGKLYDKPNKKRSETTLDV